MSKILVGTVCAVAMFSGCANKMELVEQIVKDNNLGGKVTHFCYDVIDKKECPKGFLQYDVNMVRYLPFTSRFCLGVSDNNATPLDGMVCTKHNFIK